MEIQNHEGNMGLFVFLDLTYLELDLAYLHGTQNVSTTTTMSGPYVNSIIGNNAEGNSHAVEAALFLKYPFYFGSRFRFFPLLGASFIYVFSAESEGIKSEKPKDGSSLGFMGGLGLDIALTPGLFIRAEALYNMRLPSGGQQSAYENSDSPAPNANGFQAKVGVGFAL